ncbi:SDR family NAD(P)-dependent oxidoreductase [Cryobacterium sp. 1639]|uniref:SDR family NAD(P)-dependent oxidoreductase n=1 Tax=Cryobacterium inferilacus TaxID=2866629 RepID=UPI001C73410E|nr:SDR family NAD(P)-dependent oxidoreductase [Cryobacterium sp. 1639]MBX0299169.1 SDR family NAD(P)-dependent oxidoreductase [Cryobacterium sp. 1639]
MPEPVVDPAGVAGHTVLIAGATSTAGVAVAAALAGAGAQVLAVGSDAERLERVIEVAPDASVYVCDLADYAQVTALAATLHAEHGPIDGLVHLVGGWRGGGGLDGQTDTDWDFLHERVVQTLRNTTRAFNADLLASFTGRLAIVSSVSVDAPTPGGANYASAKAAAETWTRAVGHGFAKSGDTAAAVIFAVRSLDGLEPRLAAEVVALWDAPAAALNNTRRILTP